MQVLQYPSAGEWPALIQRPVLEAALLEKKVAKIIAAVKKGGDKAVKKYTRDFEGLRLKHLSVTAAEFSEAIASVDPVLRAAIELAKANIEKFHAPQLQPPVPIETMPGVRCWRKNVAIEKVGIYIPGGTAPLFSTVLMLAIPAKLAGCKDIILCTPAGKDGKINPAVLLAAQLSGVTKVFKAGGAQAIAAMAYGTDSIPRVYKIAGPGNQYVTCAKQLVQMDGVAIDMPAGPSEVCVLADDSADPSFIAADLLSQAEHGPDSQVLLVSTSAALIEKVQEELAAQLAVLPRMEFAARSLDNSKAVLVKTMEEGLQLVNEYAAEHLIISCEAAGIIAEQVVNAGSVFIGPYSPESVGDYASGTNHTLPTNGFARAYSGVSVDSFLKKITYQELTKQGLQNIGAAVETMAIAEGLQAHAHAVRIRLKKMNNQ